MLNHQRKRRLAPRLEFGLPGKGRSHDAGLWCIGMSWDKVYDVRKTIEFETVAPTGGETVDLAQVDLEGGLKREAGDGLAGGQFRQENVLRFDKIPGYFGENGKT